MKHLAVVVAAAVLFIVAVSVYTGHRDGRSQRKSDLMRLGLAYHDANFQSGPPQEVDDIEPYLNGPDIDRLILAVRAKRYVLIWNAQFSHDGNANDRFILGYEADAPKKGGFVLLGGGLVKEMTADEYQAMPLIPTLPAPSADGSDG